MVFLKTTHVRGEVVVAICDEEILGRKLKDTSKKLVFDVSELFYKGEKMELQESVTFLTSATIANLVGAKIVEAAINVGHVKQSAVTHIDGVPHAQVIKFRRT
ncbi:MAG: DUF424 domain-containing protein [Candidatus Bathyarchaeia archaeon]